MPAPAHIFKTARKQLRKIRFRGPKNETEQRLVSFADQQREQGLGWRYDGLISWSNEQLFDALRKISLDFDQQSFEREAQLAGTPTKLSLEWEKRSTAQGKWRELPMLAARELWRRLLPGLRCIEAAADDIDELLEEAAVRPADQAALWLQAARRLVESSLPGGNADRTFFEAMLRESGNDLTGWMLEMPATLLGTDHADEAADICAAFAQLIDSKAMRCERAEILAQIGRGSEAVADIEELLAAFPGDPVVLLKAGAVYETLRQSERSQEFFRRYTEAMQKPDAASSIAAAAKVGVQLPRFESEPLQTMPGPNERCPCGSGKKYKRCHGLPS